MKTFLLCFLIIISSCNCTSDWLHFSDDKEQEQIPTYEIPEDTVWEEDEYPEEEYYEEGEIEYNPVIGVVITHD